MAASIVSILRSSKSINFCHLRGFYRTLLSDAYKCSSVWQQQVQAPYLENVDLRNFGVELLQHFDKEKQFSAVDIEVFAHKLEKLQPVEEEMAQEILFKFRHCNQSCPVNESIYHAVVRGYLAINKAEMLVKMITNRQKYGIFPDNQGMCILIDHFLVRDDYKNAAKLAYEVMLQEDFRHKTVTTLALYAAVKHFYNTMDFTRQEPVHPDPDEEIDYVPVAYIQRPYYDDHFDVKEERFLLGKTLYILGRYTQRVDQVQSRSLQLIGLGLYEKFEKANMLLEEWINNAKRPSSRKIIYQEALDKYLEYLEEAPTRDPEAPEKELGELTLEDEIELLKLTPAQKEECLNKFKELVSSIPKRKLHTLNTLEKGIEHFAECRIPQYEPKDIEILTQNLLSWGESREQQLEEQVQSQTEHIQMNLIQKKLLMLQEKEELLTYVDNKDIILGLAREGKEKHKEDKVVSEFVEAPGERGNKMRIKRR